MMAGKKMYTCIGCTHPTSSELRLCPDCKRARTERDGKPCTGCGKRTKAKGGVCQDCKRQMGYGGTLCGECGVTYTDRVDGTCYGCVLAIKDDNSTRGLEESRYDLDDLGHWAVDARGVWRFVEGPPAPRRVAA